MLGPNPQRNTHRLWLYFYVRLWMYWWLEKSYEDRSIGSGLATLRVDPIFESAPLRPALRRPAEAHESAALKLQIPHRE